MAVSCRSEPDAAPVPDRRIPWTTSRVAGSPDPPLPFRAVRAFPKLSFKSPLYMTFEPGTGRAIVALDSVGCGEGQLVLVVQGSSARMTDQTKNLPADALVIGIVDSAVFAGKTFYQASEARGRNQ